MPFFRRSSKVNVPAEQELTLEAETLESRMMLSAVDIFAAGSTGEEAFNVLIDGRTVATFAVGQEITQFTVEADDDVSADDVQVFFINDIYDPANNFDRNLIVDKIRIGGVDYEAEAPETFSTGTWRAEDGVTPGNRESEFLHANGFMQFSTGTRSELEVFVAGAEGDERYRVLVDGDEIGQGIATREGRQLRFTTEQTIAPEDVRVEFVNDLYAPENGFDRNLFVDKIVIDGIEFETEDPRVFSTGTWTADLGVTPGFRQSETLHTNGFFQFGFGSLGELSTYDGSGNNLENTQWGAAGENFLRQSGAAYTDGIGDPPRQDQPGAREISNRFNDQSASIENDRFLTSVWFQWGQFLDHDISRAFTMDRSIPAESFDINQELPFTRSVAAAGTGVDSTRQQVNHISAYIDGSVVYGNDEARVVELRAGNGGRMDSFLSESGELLPLNTAGLPNAAPPSPAFFVAGDVRANENIALAAMQTLFVREHNRYAGELAATEFADADLSDAAVDEEIFQRARQYVTGLIQHITYNEFLPSTLGFAALGTYQGYDSSVNAQLTTEFATAAYRIGHTTLPNELIIDEAGNTLSLAEAFSNPEFIKQNGIDGIFAGTTSQRMQEVDPFVVDGVRNLLNAGGGFDLAARNIQRGRDHGLPDYNSVREAIGLERVDSFDQITSNHSFAQTLTELYQSPDNADPWVAMIAEDHVPGTSTGETIHAYMVDQFTRLRDGDRFYFENVMDADTAAEVKATRLADIIRRNTGATVQNEVFWTSDTVVFRNGLDNEWLVRDFGDNGGIEIVAFGVPGERDPDNRDEVIPVRVDAPVNAVVIAGINEGSDGFFIPNALVPTPLAELGVDEFIVTADLDFFEGYGLGGDDRWVIEGDIASVFASGDQGDDVLIVNNGLQEAEIGLLGGAGMDSITVAATGSASVIADGGSGDDAITLTNVPSTPAAAGMQLAVGHSTSIGEAKAAGALKMLSHFNRLFSDAGQPTEGLDDHLAHRLGAAVDVGPFLRWSGS